MIKQIKRLNTDGKAVLILTLTIVTIGVYMVYSASRVWSANKLGDQFYYLKRQLIFALLGTALMMAAMCIKKQWLLKHCGKILIISFLSLGLVLIPGIGLVRGGSRSWFGVASFALQPAEFFKIAIIIYAAKILGQNYQTSRQFLQKVFPVLAIAMLAFALIMLQPDFGTGLVMLSSIIIMTLLTKAPLKIYLRMGIAGVVALIGLIISAPYRLERITAFINPWQDPLGSGFQIIQSLYAIAPGGLVGQGIDNSIQKYFYLPEPQTDFIFSIIAEEFGFIGGALLIVLFLLLFYKGLNLAKNSKDYFSCFLAAGIISLFAVQVTINLGVVCGMLPVTGITLPLISYGGSSLTIMMFGIGILLSTAVKEEHEEENTN